MRTQEPIRQCFVFAQQAQQKVFGLDVRRAELAGFVTSKKDYPPRLFCVAFKHVPPCERPLLLPPSLLNGPGCVFYRCADPPVCSSGRTYLYLLLFNTSLRVSFSITSALFRSLSFVLDFELPNLVLHQLTSPCPVQLPPVCLAGGAKCVRSVGRNPGCE